MAKIESFTHECDEQTSKPIMNYAVIYDNEPKRSECFGNALIDEQFILSANHNNKIDDTYVEQVMNGCESLYPDSTVYFFPKKEATKVKSIINDLVNKWKNGQDSSIYYSEEGDIYIALRSTDKGIWVLTYDGTTVIAFEKANDMFSEHFDIQNSFENSDINFEQPFVVENNEESSGDAFFEYMENYQEVFDFMKKEGLFDDKCYK